MKHKNMENKIKNLIQNILNSYYFKILISRLVYILNNYYFQKCIRLFLSLVLIYFVYKETGWATTTVITLIMLNEELKDFVRHLNEL